MSESKSTQAFRERFISKLGHRHHSERQPEEQKLAMDHNLDSNFYQDNITRISESVKKNIVSGIMKKIGNQVEDQNVSR